MKYFQNLGVRLGYGFRVLLFIFSLGLISLMLPKEGKFRYEFQKNSPWLHEELIAKFDFPVYKAEEEINAERDSILNEYKPYFNLDEGVKAIQQTKFEIRFEKKWDEYVKTHFKANENEEDNFEQTKLKTEIFKNAGELLEFVYDRGIIESYELLEQQDANNVLIYVVKGNVAEERLIKETFDRKKAYDYILEEISKKAREFKDSTNSTVFQFYKSLDYYDLIEPNLSYDEATSKRAKENLMTEISPTRGMVQKGELIISRGELVDKDTYRILESYKREYEEQLGISAKFNIVFLGHILLVFYSLLMIFLFLRNFRKEILQNSWKTLFILFLVTFMVFIATLPVKYDEFIKVSFYIVPFAILPIAIRIFYDSRLALFIHIMTVLMVGFIAPNPFEHVFLNTIAGIVAIFSLTNLYRRDRLVIAAAYVSISYSIVYLAIAVVQEGSFSQISWVNFGWFALNGVLVLVTYPLIFVFEKSFGFLSDTTLMELSDTNQPLLRKLAEKAPGTFQHSLQVASLAEEAVRMMEGNPMLVRTGALYHDIGKIEKPMYFIENQSSGFNPHDKLGFEESAEIIIGHVEAGVKMAKKHGLPDQIIDFIRTHHGTTTVQYFYRSYLNQYPDKEVDIKKFSYPGPKPFSKETAVMMMADSVEAASRSLKTITEEVIDNLVDKIIDNQMKEGQFVNADITFKDVTKTKELFKKKLRNIYHARIEYPDEVKKE